MTSRPFTPRHRHHHPPSPQLSHLPAMNLSPLHLPQSLATSILPSGASSKWSQIGFVRGVRLISLNTRSSRFTCDGLGQSLVLSEGCPSFRGVSMATFPRNCATGRRRAPTENTWAPLFIFLDPRTTSSDLGVQQARLLLLGQLILLWR